MALFPCEDYANGERTIAGLTQLLCFSRFVESLPMNPAFRYSGHFSEPNRLRVKNRGFFLVIRLV